MLAPPSRAMSDLTAPCGHVEAARSGIHKGESASDGIITLQRRLHLSSRKNLLAQTWIV
jgi:hypothetical protein